MKLHGVLPFARELLTRVVSEGDIAVDCTAGNGHDTLFLTRLTGSNGHVYSFDVQQSAIDNTRTRLEEHGVIDHTTLLFQGHEHLAKAVPLHHLQKVKAAIFNLGYLPGSDKTVVTKPSSTIDAVTQLLEHMPKEGLIVLVIYHGHEEGKQERDALLEFVVSLDPKQAHVLRYEFINQVNDPPFIIAIEKR